MYDTITFWLDTNETEHITGLLEKAQERIDKETGECYCIGLLKNLRLKIKADGLSINGSLPKFKYGHNLRNLKIEEVKSIIEEIGDTLRLPIYNSQIYRLDMAANIIMKKPTREYLCCFGDASRYEKITYWKTMNLIYKNSMRAMAFYDKIKEMKRHHEYIPEEYQNNNILRYELRFLNRLKKQLKINENLRAYQLYDEKFFRYMINRWQEEYFSINRLQKIKLASPNKITDLREFKNQLAAIGIKEIGGVDKIIEILKNAKDSNAINKLQFQRMRRGITKLCLNPSYIERNDLILELDEKINRVVEEFNDNLRD